MGSIAGSKGGISEELKERLVELRNRSLKDIIENLPSDEIFLGDRNKLGVDIFNNIIRGSESSKEVTLERIYFGGTKREFDLREKPLDLKYRKWLNYAREYVDEHTTFYKNPQLYFKPRLQIYNDNSIEIVSIDCSEFDCKKETEFRINYQSDLWVPNKNGSSIGGIFKYPAKNKDLHGKLVGILRELSG